MTEDRVGNIAKALGTVIAVIVLMLAIIAHAFGQVVDIQPSGGQNSATHDHNGTSFRRFDSIRLNPPAKVTGIIQTEQGERIEWVSYDRFEIRNGSFTLSKDTQKDPKVKEKVWVWIVFCTEDRYVYAIYPLSETQRAAVK